MRCERAVTLLATGGILGRWRARRHAARCQGCAAEVDRLQRIARELSVVEPLSAAERALWTSASTEPRPSAAPPARYRPALLAGAAAAVVLIVAIGVTLVIRRPPPMPIREPSIVQSRDLPQRPSPAEIRELDGLRTRFQSLAQEVAQLRRRAELLDERRDAKALSDRFHRTVGVNGP